MTDNQPLLCPRAAIDVDGTIILRDVAGREDKNEI
jgi:hypothetical protein